MILTGRRLLAALGLATTVAVPGCSHEEAKVSLTVGQTPSAYHFFSHGIPIGWVLQFDLVLQERSGVAVRLERMVIDALDRGTGQAFGTETFERVTLEQVGLTDITPGGRVTYPVQIGQVQDPPRGPIAIAIQVFGTGAKGNAVSARLGADYPLAPLPPPPLP